jgi:DNA-binding transcriptional ArsR family regulator
MGLQQAFKALNDKTRRDILEMLRKKDLTAGEISEKFDMSAPSISHHLDILRSSGLISSEKKGQFILYTLNSTVLDDIMKWMIQLKKK